MDKKTKEATKSQVDIISVLILLALSLVWGSSFILIKKSLIALSPLQVACFRIAIAGIAFFPFFIKEIKKVSAKDYKFLLIVSVGGSGIPSFLYSLAQTEVSSSIAGLLNSMTPLFTLILGVIFFNSKLNLLKTIGVLLGFLGVSLLLIFGKETGVGSNIIYPLLIVIATIGYAISVNTVGSYLSHLRPITISSIAFGIITIPAIVILLFTNISAVISTNEHAWSSLMYVSILSFFGTFLANIFFYKLVHRTDALFSSTVSYVIPIVAIAWGALDNEIIGIYHILGFLLILSGVYLTRGKKKASVSKKS